MTVHAAIYVSRLWHATKQPRSKRDNWIQSNEIISMWEPSPEEEADPNGKWGCPWHIANPHVLRLRFEGVTLEDIHWLGSSYYRPPGDSADGAVTIAKRLWRLELAPILDAERVRLGRDVDLSRDIVTFDQARREALFKRKVEGGLLDNKSAEDIELNDPLRAFTEGRVL